MSDVNFRVLAAMAPTVTAPSTAVLALLNERDSLRAQVERVRALANEGDVPYPAECACNHGMGFQWHRHPCRYADEVPKVAIRAALDQP